MLSNNKIIWYAIKEQIIHEILSKIEDTFSENKQNNTNKSINIKIRNINDILTTQTSEKFFKNIDWLFNIKKNKKIRLQIKNNWNLILDNYFFSFNIEKTKIFLNKPQKFGTCFLNCMIIYSFFKGINKLSFIKKENILYINYINQKFINITDVINILLLQIFNKFIQDKNIITFD